MVIVPMGHYYKLYGRSRINPELAKIAEGDRVSSSRVYTAVNDDPFPIPDVDQNTLSSAGTKDRDF